jgi:hypothetical protein
MAAGGNMEGKEVRFGIFNSALFATITTDASCGAVNSMHDSFTALGGFVPLFNIQLGEIIIGGVGAGLYGMLVFVVLAVFIAGLMVGRTPEYLGKKIQSYDVKMSMLALLVLALSILGFSAWASVSKWGTDALNNAGPHGLSEILYAFSSANGNNGSAFAGLSANTPWLNTTLGLAMLIGRFLMIVPIMGLAGSLAGKKFRRPAPGPFRFRRHLCHFAAGHGAAGRRAELSAGAHAGAGHRTFPDQSRQTLLIYDAQSSFSFRLGHCRAGPDQRVQETGPARDDQEPRHVCHHGRRGADDHPIFTGAASERGFIFQLALWLWFTVLFANFAEAVAEGRGKAQADSLRKSRKETIARRLRNKKEEPVPATDLLKGDLVVCEAGDIIPADGDVIEGIASVDEAAITGESAPVIRESGGDRCAVTGGTRVLSDRIVIRVTSEKGNTFLDRMIAMVEGARRQKTPNEIALTILLSALTLIFLLVCVTLKPFGFIPPPQRFLRARAGGVAGLFDSHHHWRTVERHWHQRH